MKIAILVLAILLLIAIGVIVLLIWKHRREKLTDEKINGLVKHIDDLIKSRITEMEEKIDQKYKTPGDINSALDDLGFQREQ